MVPALLGLAREPCERRDLAGAGGDDRRRADHVPHSLGLAVAEQEGQARRIEPGEVAEPWIVLRPQSGVTSVSSVDRDGRVVP